MVKNPPASAGDRGSLSGSGRSPGGGNGTPLQCSCLRNPMDKRSLAGYSPWYCKSRTRLSTHVHYDLSSSTRDREIFLNNKSYFLLPSKVKPKSMTYSSTMSFTLWLQVTIRLNYFCFPPDSQCLSSFFLHLDVLCFFVYLCKCCCFCLEKGNLIFLFNASSSSWIQSQRIFSTPVLFSPT